MNIDQKIFINKTGHKYMKLEDIKDILEAEVLWGNSYLDREVKMAYGSDLLSDVLAFAQQNILLITGLINPQVIRTAEMVDVSAVCFVRGKKPDDSTVALAREKEIPIFRTKLTLYESCGRLYSKGLPGGSEVREEM